ncbi:hypothetical protein NQ317_015977 [Molorchus minor]|uniref:Tyr recombinase domain-containing protein n=1 Tax=Molorchus minor TaxID=1323400 RepID=A0ABQ9JSQ6_9CUCU|nr:hypothetical protein NQ317_015977 [Molorchus minor]
MTAVIHEGDVCDTSRRKSNMPAATKPSKDATISINLNMLSLYKFHPSRINGFFVIVYWHNTERFSAFRAKAWMEKFVKKENLCTLRHHCTMNNCESEEIVEAANIAISNLLPTKSRSLYDRFKKWCAEKNVQVYSENVLLAYFSENAKNYKSSTLWAQYSMVKSCLIIYDNIDISKFPKLIAFFKRTSDGYQAKKSKILTKMQMTKEFLMIKVGLILGIAGACRTDELVNLTVDDIEDVGSSLIVKITNTKTKIPRIFVLDWKSTTVAEGYVENSIENKTKIIANQYLLFFNFECFIYATSSSPLTSQTELTASSQKTQQTSKQREDNPSNLTGPFKSSRLTFALFFNLSGFPNKSNCGPIDLLSMFGLDNPEKSFNGTKPTEL